MKPVVSSQPSRRSGSWAAVPSLRVAWVGEKPAWLTREAEAGALAGVELHFLPSESIPTGTGRAEAPDVFHLAGEGRDLQKIRRVYPNSAIVLDLSHKGGAFEGRLRGSFDLILVGSRVALRELRRRNPALVTRSLLFRPPVDLSEHGPGGVLAEPRRQAFTRFVDERGLRPPVVLFAGPFVEPAGLDLAIEAVLSVRELTPKIQMVALRDGPLDRPYFAQCAHRAGELGDSVFLEVAPTQGEIAYWYAAAAVVCLPARHGDGGGALTARLAAAAARPFVGTEVDMLLEEVIDGETGFLIPLDDLETLSAAIAALIGDDEEARRLGDNARRRIELEVASPSAAERLRAAWHRALDGRSARRTLSNSR